MASWLSILDELYRDSWNDELGRFRSPYAFRGMGRFDDGLESSLVRLAAGRPDVQPFELAILRKFSK